MAGLTDMEELIATVPDKDVASYLKEALQCYGAGAYRGCIVLSQIALFDGLRRKIKALAPVNATAKSVSDEIEPLAEAQQVFELPLIHKLKAASIITTLEAQSLEQLNKQRNKAAHPSGHVVTAEEARYVFSESIVKFLSQPIRQTSYIVDQIITKISDPNFFPSNQVPDLQAVVDQEIENLDPAAFPFLIAKLSDALSGADTQAVGNSKSFLLVLAARKDSTIRDALMKKLIDPKSSLDSNAEFFSTLICGDPKIITAAGPGTLLRLQNLLIINAKEHAAAPYIQLRNPAHVLVQILSELGETTAYAKLKDFIDEVIKAAPYVPPFVSGIAAYPTALNALYAKYVEKASSSDFNTANAFAGAVSTLDDALAAALTEQQVFRLLSGVVRAAEHGAWGAQNLSNNKFVGVPKLKGKAIAYVTSDPSGAATTLTSAGIADALPSFSAKYL